jgi:anti-sigma regulatory factor (Ser/Thr protein kinase)/CheY-like chemotaxis protein
MNRRRALLVDANPEVTAMAAGVFRADEWEVEQVPSNAAALRAVEARPFSVILTSEKTTGSMDLDLLRRIRRIRPHTRVIILAHHGTPEDVVSAMRENAFSYFSEPFFLDQLKRMLETVIAAPPWDDGIELISATPSWIHLFARCDMTTANRIIQFLNEISEGIPEKERNNVSFAFREMLINAIEHGGHFDPMQYVEISYVRSERAVSCRIRDTGQGFSLEEIPHAALSNPPDEPFRHLAHREEQKLRPGGYGVLLAKKLVDELIYSEKGNEVILIKYLDASSSPSSPRRSSDSAHAN